MSAIEQRIKTRMQNISFEQQKKTKSEQHTSLFFWKISLYCCACLVFELFFVEAEEGKLQEDK